MKKMKPAVVSVLLASLLAPFSAQALGLGAVTTKSALYEPLSADVTLYLNPGDDAARASISIASKARFEEAGMHYPSWLSEVTSQIEFVGKTGHLHLKSRKPVYDPVVTLLIEVHLPNGIARMPVTIMLDTPFSQPLNSSLKETVLLPQETKAIAKTKNTAKNSTSVAQNTVTKDKVIKAPAAVKQSGSDSASRPAIVGTLTSNTQTSVPQPPAKGLAPSKASGTTPEPLEAKAAKGLKDQVVSPVASKVESKGSAKTASVNATDSVKPSDVKKGDAKKEEPKAGVTEAKSSKTPVKADDVKAASGLAPSGATSSAPSGITDKNELASRIELAKAEMAKEAIKDSLKNQPAATATPSQTSASGLASAGAVAVAAGANSAASAAGSNTQPSDSAHPTSADPVVTAPAADAPANPATGTESTAAEAPASVVAAPVDHSAEPTLPAKPPILPSPEPLPETPSLIGQIGTLGLGGVALGLVLSGWLIAKAIRRRKVARLENSGIDAHTTVTQDSYSLTEEALNAGREEPGLDAQDAGFEEVEQPSHHEVVPKLTAASLDIQDLLKDPLIEETLAPTLKEPPEWQERTAAAAHELEAAVSSGSSNSQEVHHIESLQSEVFQPHFTVAPDFKADEFDFGVKKVTPKTKADLITETLQEKVALASEETLRPILSDPSSFPAPEVEGQDHLTAYEMPAVSIDLSTLPLEPVLSFNFEEPKEQAPHIATEYTFTLPSRPALTKEDSAGSEAQVIDVPEETSPGKAPSFEFNPPSLSALSDSNDEPVLHLSHQTLDSAEALSEETTHPSLLSLHTSQSFEIDPALENVDGKIQLELACFYAQDGDWEATRSSLKEILADADLKGVHTEARRLLALVPA